MKHLKKEKFLRQLEQSNDEWAKGVFKSRREKKREKKRKVKENARLGDKGQASCMNYEVGDVRFADNYKCDWKQTFKDREKSLANEMSKAQFRNDPDSDDVENERDMGSDTELGIIKGL